MAAHSSWLSLHPAVPSGPVAAVSDAPTGELVEVITAGLSELSRVRPDNPEIWLANWMWVAGILLSLSSALALSIQPCLNPGRARRMQEGEPRPHQATLNLAAVSLAV
jgi:hypothetical protein